MNEFEDVLDPESVFFGVQISNKKGLFKEIARHAAAIAGGGAKAVESLMAERERLGSTGFGGGIAIPHARLDWLDRPFGIFMRLARPIDYDSVDGLPVDCVFALFSPTGSGAAHLQALARISRRFRDEKFVAKLRGARSEDALYALLTNFEAADAA